MNYKKDLTFLSNTSLSLAVGDVRAYTTSDADSLYTGITFGYNRFNRPSATVAVSVDFQLISINYLVSF